MALCLENENKFAQLGSLIEKSSLLATEDKKPSVSQKPKNPQPRAVDFLLCVHRYPMTTYEDVLKKHFTIG